MSRSIMDLWVGIFVVAGMAALLVLAFKVGNLAGYSRGETYSLHGEFDNIGGLKVRAPVKSAGVVVGRVSDIGFDTQTFRAKVTFKVEKRYQFPKDTFAKIQTAGLLGEQYIGLDPGGDPDNLADGDKVFKTQPAVVLENLIGQFLYSKAAEGDGQKDGGNQTAR